MSYSYGQGFAPQYCLCFLVVCSCEWAYVILLYQLSFEVLWSVGSSCICNDLCCVLWIVIMVGMEECPKWSALKEVMEEIEADCRSADQEFQSVRILIIAHDDRTCSQIKSVSQFQALNSQFNAIRMYDKQVLVVFNSSI